MKLFEGEAPIALSDVPAYLPKRHGKKTHYSTVFRWATKGARGRRLETVLVGGIRYTSFEALERFLSVEPTSHRARISDVTLVERALEAAGF